MTSHHKQIRLGADVGGTFTDVILLDDSGTTLEVDEEATRALRQQPE